MSYLKKLIIILCFIVVICASGCSSTDSEIKRTERSLTSILSSIDVSADDGLDTNSVESDVDWTNFYVMGKMGDLTPHFADKEQTEIDAFFWKSKEEFTKSNFQEYIEKLTIFYEDEPELEEDKIFGSEAFYWNVSDTIKAYTWLDEDTYANCAWLGPNYLTYTSDQYRNTKIAKYFPDIDGNTEKWWAFVLSYQGYDIEDLLKTGAVNLDEWTPAGEYSGEYYVKYYESDDHVSYVKEGTLFSKEGCFIIDIAAKTNKFMEFRFSYYDDGIDGILQTIHDMLHVEIVKEKYVSAEKMGYFLEKDDIYKIRVFYDSIDKYCEVDSVHNDTYDEMIELSHEDEYQENQALYNTAVAGYWELRRNLKSPSSLIVDSTKYNGDRIIFKYRARNSFNAQVTEYAMYYNGKLTSSYAEVYFNSSEAKTITWYVLTHFSQSKYCNNLPIDYD